MSGRPVKDQRSLKSQLFYAQVPGLFNGLNLICIYIGGGGRTLCLDNTDSLTSLHLLMGSHSIVPTPQCESLRVCVCVCVCVVPTPPQCVCVCSFRPCPDGLASQKLI